jgi:hypothetical protein
MIKAQHEKAVQKLLKDEFELIVKDLNTVENIIVSKKMRIGIYTEPIIKRF